MAGHPQRRYPARVLAVALTAAALPGAVVLFAPAGDAAADVCVGAGRRVNVSGCVDIAGAVNTYAPPPAWTHRPL